MRGGRVAAGLAVVVALLALSGCGRYARDFTPPVPLFSAEELDGVWVHEHEDAFQSFLVIKAEGTLRVVGVPAEALDDAVFDAAVLEHSTDLVDASGTWDAPEQDVDAFPNYVITLPGREADLYVHRGVFGEEQLFFWVGDMDDAQWYRFEKLED